MVLSFADSFVRASSAETNVTATSDSQPAGTVSRPPWVKAVENFDVLPRTLYPILPPPQPYSAGVQPANTSRCSSSVTMAADTVMSHVQQYEDEEEDVDGTPLDATTLANYAPASPTADSNELEDDIDSDIDMDDQDSSSEFEDDCESEDDTLGTWRGVRTRSMRRKGNATKVNQAVNKRNPPKRIAKAVKKTTSTSKKAPATSRSTSDGPARRTRSSTSSQQSKAQITGYDGVDLGPLKGKYKTRKTWHYANRATLKKAIHNWWAAGGSAAYNNPRRIMVPEKNEDEEWLWIRAECKRLNEKFNQSHLGVTTIARRMWVEGKL